MPCTHEKGHGQADAHGHLQLPGESQGVRYIGISGLWVSPPLFGWPASTLRIFCAPWLGRGSGRGLNLRFRAGRAVLSRNFNVSHTRDVNDQWDWELREAYRASSLCKEAIGYQKGW